MASKSNVSKRSATKKSGKKAVAKKSPKNKEKAPCSTATCKCGISGLMLDSLPTPVVAVDTDFNLIFINRPGSEMVGRAQEGCIGEKCYSLLKTEHCHTAQCQMANAIQHGGVCTGETVARLPSGPRPIRYTCTTLKDSGGNLVGAMETIIDISKEVEVTESLEALTRSVTAGKLDTRADVENFQGNFKKIVQGINDTVEAVTGPLQVAAEYLDWIAKGNIPEKITQDYKGSFKEIMDNLNHCIDGLGGLMEANTVLQRMALNDHTMKVEGEYQGLYSEMSIAVNTVRERLLRVTEISDDIAKGDLSDLEPLRQIGGGKGRRSENDRLAPAIIKMIESIKILVDEAADLTDQVREGKLHCRARGEGLEGEFKKVIVGINETLDAIVFPINEAMAVLEKVANQDLTSKVVGDYQGQLNEFKENINKAIKNLHDAMTQAASASDQVGAASVQIASSSQSLADGAARQAASLEETSSSLEQMSTMVKQNAQNSNQANNLMHEAEQVVYRAKQSMDELTRSMEEISGASEETQKIIKTIDEIAFQTNLLALNAAVEAARAGEAGAGFAVVADEVRNLAMRAAEAAKNTADLIEGTVKKVKAGSELVEKTNSEFNEVATSATKVAGLVSEISEASNEQAQGIEQVNKAVAEMDKVTQESAANAEESASAAEEMSAQAQELNSMLGAFELNWQGRRQVSAAIGMDGSTGRRLDRLNALEGRRKPEDIIPFDDDREPPGDGFKDF